MRLLFLVVFFFLVACSESGDKPKSNDLAKSLEAEKSDGLPFPRRLDPVTVRRDDMTPDYRRGPTSITTNVQTTLALPPELIEELKNPQGWENSLVIGTGASSAKPIFKVNELVFTRATIPSMTPSFSMRSAASHPWVAIAIRKLKIMDESVGGAIITPDFDIPPTPANAQNGSNGVNGGRNTSVGNGTDGGSGVNGRHAMSLNSTIYLIVGEVELAGKTAPPPGLPPTFSIRNYDGAIIREYTKSYPLLLRFSGGRGGNGGAGGHGGSGGRGREGSDAAYDGVGVNCTRGPGNGGAGGNGGNGGRGGAAGNGGKSGNLVIVASPQAIAHLEKAFINLDGGKPGIPGDGGDFGEAGEGGDAGNPRGNCSGSASNGNRGNSGSRGDAGYSGTIGASGRAIMYERNVSEWWPATVEGQ